MYANIKDRSSENGIEERVHGKTSQGERHQVKQLTFYDASCVVNIIRNYVGLQKIKAINGISNDQKHALLCYLKHYCVIDSYYCVTC